MSRIKFPSEVKFKLVLEASSERYWIQELDRSRTPTDPDYHM